MSDPRSEKRPRAGSAKWLGVLVGLQALFVFCAWILSIISVVGSYLPVLSAATGLSGLSLVIGVHVVRRGHVFARTYSALLCVAAALLLLFEVLPRLIGSIRSL